MAVNSDGAVVVLEFSSDVRKRFCTGSLRVSVSTQVRCRRVSWNVIFLFIWGLGLKRSGLAL